MNPHRLFIVFYCGLLIHLSQTTQAQQLLNQAPKEFSKAGNFSFKLYPMGWSKNETYFAYATHNTATGEASPPEGYYFSMHIQDVRNDKIIYSKEIRGSEFCGDNDCDFSFNTLWKSYNKHITAHLALYNIDIPRELTWTNLPLRANNTTYTVSTEDSKNTKSRITHQKVKITATTLGSKYIHNKNLEESNSQLLESWITGAFVSPTKNKLLIVKRNIHNGHEGTKHTDFNLIGSDLKKGFSITDRVSNHKNDLVLFENALGDFKLHKGMPLSEEKIKNFFPHFKVTKTIGAQDGPNFFRYAIGNNIHFSTPSTDSDTLEEINITQDSTFKDQYDVQLGMTIEEVATKRGPLKITTTMHYHIYLYQKDSNIMYEMSLGTYDDFDKYTYTIDELIKYNSKVKAIHWR